MKNFISPIVQSVSIQVIVNSPSSNIPRVIGARTKESGDQAEKFYRTILEVDTLTRVDLKEAESVKMVENAFRDINIAFVNELAMSFDKLGIDLLRVLEAASTNHSALCRTIQAVVLAATAFRSIPTI